MNRAQQLLIVLHGDRRQTYEQYVTALNPLFWLKLRETTGSTAANSGSIGAALNGTIAGTTTLGETGALGAAEAFTFDGATSIITSPNNAGIQGLTAFTAFALVYPTGAGESNTGTLYDKTSEILLRLNSASRDIQAVVYYTGGGSVNAQIATSTTLSLNAWHTVVLRTDTDKIPHVFIDGAEAAYASQTTGVGTRATTTNVLNLGNNGPLARTWAGLIDELWIVGRALTDAEILAVHNLAGV